MHSVFHGTPLGDLWECAFRLSHSRQNASRESIITEEDAKQDTMLGIAEICHRCETMDMDPKQWSLAKKIRVVAIISLYTFAVYAGSAIYIAPVELVVQEYSTSLQTALLGLSLYVLGYGMGPLLWAPLSEVPRIGRNPVYIITATIFLVISIATALAKSLPLFLFLRFVQGFFGSPCLANGGASLHDIFEGRHLPLAQSIWVAGAYAGPAIGPIMASYLVEQYGWRISMWEIVACGAAALILLLFLPETYVPKLVHEHRKEEPVRNTSAVEKHESIECGPEIRSKIIHAGVEDSQVNIGASILNALQKPLQICIQDPAIAYVNIYTSYLYACYYTFFDGFPLVYRVTYGFSASQIGIVFLPIIVGCAVATLLYYIYILRFTPQQAEFNPEARLRPALLAVWAVPVGILLFGWTAEPSIKAHWICGMIGLAIYSGGVFIILQCMIMYVLDSYPRYAASLFASNDFSRSSLAAAAIHFGIPLYTKLGSGRACTVLGAISILGIGGMYVLAWKGAQLRAKSRFTG